MKNMYGVNNCFFLNVNSQASSQSSTQLADPWKQFLSKKLHSQVSEVSFVHLVSYCVVYIPISTTVILEY